MLKQSITASINALRVGKSVKFPIEKVTTVRSTACIRGVITGRKFVCNQDIKKGVVVVTRKE